MLTPLQSVVVVGNLDSNSKGVMCDVLDAITPHTRIPLFRHEAKGSILRNGGSFSRSGGFTMRAKGYLSEVLKGEIPG